MKCGHLFNGIKTTPMHPNRYSKVANPPKEILEHLYYNCFKTQSEIAIIFKTSQKVVFRWFRDLNIKSRTAAKRFQQGELNSYWKGDKATYSAKHYRVRTQRGKADHCELCGRNDSGISYDWANLTGDFGNVNDYLMMCRSCHFKMDEHFKNLPNHTSDKKLNKKKIHDAVRSSL